MTYKVFAAALLFQCASLVAAERDHDITIDDYFTLAWVREVAVSPDGSRVAYTEDRWEGEAGKPNRDLWVVDVETKEPRRLTFDRARDANPMWDADGRRLYFTANVERAGEKEPPWNGKTQVFRISVDGGEPEAVTRVEGGVGLVQLSPDGKRLYYTVSVETLDPEWKALREAFRDLEYGHGVTELSELWALDLASFRAEKLVDARRVIRGFQVSSDGRRIAMVTTPDNELIYYEGSSRLDVWDSETRTVRVVTRDGWRDGHPSPFGWIDSGVWSDDGQALALTVSFDGYPTRVYVAEFSRDEAGTLRELQRPGAVSIGGSLRFRPGTRDLCLLGDERARTRVYAFTGLRDGQQGPTVVLTPGEVSVRVYDFARSARSASSDDGLTVVTATLESVPDVYRVQGEGTLTRLTWVNPQIDTWKLPQISLVRWQGTDGRDVEGVLELPPDYTAQDGPLPMVVHLHGGPTAATSYSFEFRQYGRTAFAAEGWALFSPNYRGSTGYGDDFMVELVGHENDVEIRDILAGVDAMVERGIADPERLAVMGWSNGGFLTNAVIAATNRFKAASSGAGVIDQMMQWGIEDTPGHVVNFMGGKLPWADPAAYRDGSPLYGLADATTPTLIHVGGSDERVPSQHARTLYRALSFYRKLPTELVVYPNEPHGLQDYRHQKAKMAWDHAWFDRWVLEKKR